MFSNIYYIAQTFKNQAKKYSYGTQYSNNWCKPWHWISGSKAFNGSKPQFVLCIKKYCCPYKPQKRVCQDEIRQ